jgi:hypothetical protein
VLPPVPYELAQFWDRGLREHHNRRVHNRSQKKAHTSEESDEVGHVPRDLRATAKRTPAVKSWLRVLEEPVREFVVERGLAVIDTAAPADKEEAGGESSDETDPDDEEIVFVGRNGRMRDGKPWKKAQRQVVGGENPGATVERGMVLEMEEGGGGAFQCVVFFSFLLLSLVTFFFLPFFFFLFHSSLLLLFSWSFLLPCPFPSSFGQCWSLTKSRRRWLTHSISDYYGLDSKSVMVGNPSRRVVYVGAKQKQPAARHKPPSRPVLPPPLWETF